MIRLPLAKRELGRVALSPRTFWLRNMVMFSALFILLFYTFVIRDWVSPSPALMGAPEEIANAMRGVGTAFQFVIVFLVVPGLTGPSIAEERRSESLGLLMVAGFRSADIFAAKFICAFAEAEMLLLSTLPILSISAMLGGMTVDMMLKQWFVLSVCAFAVCCLGLLISSFVRHAVSAIVWILAVIAAIVAGNFAFHEILFWQFRKSWPKVDLIETIHGLLANNQPLSAWWVALSIIAGLGVAAAIATLLRLPHAAVLRPRRRWFGPPTAYGATYRRLLRSSPAAPFIAAYSAGFLSTLNAPSARRTLAVGMALIALIPGAGALAVLFLLCFDVTLSLQLMRRGGALEDLTLTRMGERRLARDIYTFHLRRAVVYFPAFIVVALQVALFSMWTLDWYVTTTNGSMRIYQAFASMPDAGRALYQTVLVVLFVAFMVIQGPMIVAVACASGAAPERRVPAWTRAVLVAVCLYVLCVLIPVIAHYQLFSFRFVRSLPWLPGLAFAVVSVGMFAAVWWLAWRWFCSMLGAEGGAQPRARWPRGPYWTRANAVE